MLRDRKGVGQHDAAARLISTSGDLNDRIGCSRDVLEKDSTSLGRSDAFEMRQSYKNVIVPCVYDKIITKSINK